MCAGHILLKILSSFLFKVFSAGFLLSVVALIPFPIFTGIIGLEFAICFIQAYVFTLLTCSYIKDAIDLH
jgi:F-type H+-transporting ATPase subunit a